MFDEGFNDQILHSGRSLDVLFRYLRDNPRRLAVRQACPERFRRVNGMEVCGRNVQAYGNLFLLHHPFKEQVVIHRADSAEKRMRNRERWLYTASNGGVLVSPFISSDEKAVRAEAEAAGARIIIVTNEPMGPRWKPAAHDFALCEERAASDSLDWRAPPDARNVHGDELSMPKNLHRAELQLR